MNKERLKKSIENQVRKYVSEDKTGHDWWHITRVRSFAKVIGESENADLFIVDLGALLHDIADYKFHNGNEEIGGQIAQSLLEKAGADDKIIHKVVHIVNNVSFKGGFGRKENCSLECKVVQDADGLDAVGAIGIARCFIGAGIFKEKLHEPTQPLMKVYENKKDYISMKGSGNTALQYFYEKILKVKDSMNTQKGSELIVEKHEFTLIYLERFFKEWDYVTIE